MFTMSEQDMAQFRSAKGYIDIKMANSLATYFNPTFLFDSIPGVDFDHHYAYLATISSLGIAKNNAPTIDCSNSEHQKSLFGHLLLQRRDFSGLENIDIFTETDKKRLFAARVDWMTDFINISKEKIQMTIYAEWFCQN